jgi:hypothetical protein
MTGRHVFAKMWVFFTFFLHLKCVFANILIQIKFIHKLYIYNISVEFENYNFLHRILIVMVLEDVKKCENV